MSRANGGECVTTGGLYRPTHLSHSTLRIAQKSLTVFSCDMVRLVGWWGGGGGGVRWSMFQEIEGLYGVSERGRGELSSGLSQPGGKSCWAVWQSGL